MQTIREDKRIMGQQHLAIVVSLLLFILAAEAVQTNASILQSLSPNAWLSGNLQRSLSDPNLSNRNFTFRRNFPSGPQRQASLEGAGANHNNNQRGSSFRRNNNHCSTNYKFDYVQLTLMWSPGACATSPQECKKIQDRHFTVHGMWPTKRGTREPAFCCFDNNFDFNALKPILPELDEFWYSYIDTNSRSFWSHEWMKHGTCSRDVKQLVGELSYFGTTLKMAKSLDILGELAKAGIVPNKDDKSYSSDQIVKVLTSSISDGKAIQIDCDYEHDQPIPVLTGLNFCYDSNLTPADCPDMKNKCKRQVLFRSS